MTTGINPNYIEEIPLNSSTAPQFLVRAVETLKKTGWEITQINEEGLTAQITEDNFAWVGEFKVTVNDEFAILQSSSISAGSVDADKNEKTVNAFLDAYNQLETFSAADLALKYEALKADFPAVEEVVPELPPLTAMDRVHAFFAFFKPVEGYYITPILVNLNILIFIVMAFTGVSVFEPTTDNLLLWGANFRPAVLDGEWWRLLTNCFLHYGIFHLLMNMYALVYIGVLLEPHLGKVRFISAYLLTGITASVASLWWNDLTVSAGASGAIFGMYGVFLAMLTTNLIEKTARKELFTSIAVFVVFNLVNGIRGGIDNAAHLGGLIGGFIIGYAFIPSLKNQDHIRLKFGTIAVMAVLVLSSSFVVYSRLPNDYSEYDKKFAVFAALESEALAVYRLPEGSSNQLLMEGFKDKGVKNWTKALTIIDQLDQLNMPDLFEKRNALLRKYCELRIKSFNLAYQVLAGGTELDKEALNESNIEVNAVLDELKSKY